MSTETRLFVGNLSFTTMEREIQEHFSAAGVVVNVNLMLDKFTGKSRGFAFVEFATPEEANKAVEMFQGKDLGGRALTVNVAVLVLVLLPNDVMRLPGNTVTGNDPALPLCA